MGALSDAFWGLLDPWLFMSFSLYYLPGTILSLLQTHDWAILLSPSRLQSVWFSRFWAWAGPGVRQTAEKRVLPLLEGRVLGGRVQALPVVAPVGGVVIEVGPGTGMWVDIFSKVDSSASASGTRKDEPSRRKGGSRPNDVTKVYGVEPNAGSHAELRRRADAAGLADVYEIVPVGIESIADSGRWDGRIEDGSVDCIVSVLCLCGIPDQEANLKALYRSLKKGGRFYVYEHVKVRGNFLVGIYQRIINLVWPTIIGGCELCRDTETALRRAGPWERVDLVQPLDEPWYHTLPHIYGVLVK
ncbi:methyltransferase domain-containing protein [Plectosphaerella plurivora]|uniref:Methyltransferase domain-containing protein n=1 Tax=Plectosphaerella plurivora TaxID=936078 RepID=A0A9P8VP80_9PEZI|nr:methyltransferase domain-containing protein [Plectosphaerella plurivora]